MPFEPDNTEESSKDRRVGATLNRRRFLGGVAGLAAAAAYTAEIPETAAASVVNDADEATQTVTSPDGRLEVTVDVADGVPTYAVAFEGTTYVEASALGFEFQNQPAFGATAAGSASTPVTVTGTERTTTTETWDPVWDQYDSVSEEYTSLQIGLAEDGGPGRSANLEFRVFDDGLGFRFALGEDFAANSGQTVVTSETTQFNFADDYTAWWIPNEMVNPRFEQEYRETSLSDVDAGERTIRPNGNTLRNGAHTPLTVKAGEDAYLSVHEADLTDYATLSLAPRDDDGGTGFDAELAPLPDGTKVSVAAPTVTPWRTVQVGTEPGDLVESSLLPLLNDDLDESVLPTVDGEPDTSWITPRKYVGVWWTMIAGNANWEYKPDSAIEAEGNNPARYIHGARTERMKRYMKFASENDIDSVLVEGWNEGWDSYPGSGATMDFDESYPDFSLEEVTDYGQALSPSVEMTAHNETGGNLDNYEDQILDDDIFQYYEDNGIRSIKNGYVSNPGLIHDSENAEPTINHHCQIAINHHELVARKAAGHRQLLERHEADKPTGKRRTYPNLASTETVKAQEYDGFGALASNVGRDHHVTLPFTRMLAGPTSYQPGIFDITFNDDTGGQVQTTRAKQLAMYPTYNGGLQMAADRIEAYVNPELAVGELVQAAAGDLDGFVTADDWRNAFGTNYVAVDPNRAESGSSVSWTVTDVPEAGTYDLHLRYASDAEDNTGRVQAAGELQATLRVNGSTETINPPFTAYWDAWDVFTTQVELTEGENTVAVELHYDDSGEEFTGDVGGFNLNTVAVTEAGAESPIPASYEGYEPDDENFAPEPEFEFISEVPAGGWDDTTVVDAAIGDYTVTARRRDDDWFVGAMTNGDSRVVDVPLEFLEDAPGERKGHDGDAPGNGNGPGNNPGNGHGPGNGNGPGNSSGKGKKKGHYKGVYVAEIYADAADASVEGNPTEVATYERLVDDEDTALVSLAPSGGQAIRLRPATADDHDVPEYERPTQTYTGGSVADTVAVNESFVTVAGTNEGNVVGGEELTVVVDGSEAATEVVRFAPGEDTHTFSFGIGETGTHDVEVRRADGSVVTSGTVDVRLASGERVAHWTDPAGDDHGPGSYTYPTADVFEDGVFDLTEVSVYDQGDQYQLIYHVDGPVTNPWSAAGGYSLQFLQLYVRDPDAGDSVPSTTWGRSGTEVTFEEPYHYRVVARGGNQVAEDANGNTVSSTVSTTAAPAANAIRVSVPKSAIGGSLEGKEVAVLLFSSDGYQDGAVRAVNASNAAYFFGGGRDDNMNPNVIDMVTPEGVDQSEALAYSEDERATLPYIEL